jgi:RNA polymerase sigma factor (sigma-70 family)
MAGAPLGTIVQHLRRLADARQAAGLSDAQLLVRFARHRDEAAFAALLHRHAPLVYGVCRRVLGHAHDAEDAFQAVFLVLVRKAGSIAKGESLGCWLHEIAYRTALRARTVAHKRRTRERQAHAMNAANLDEPTAATGVGPMLDEELRRLPEQYRRPLVLCYLEGKTYAEAAEQLGWPAGTVSGRLARARELLRRRLAQRGVTLTAPALSATLTREVNAAVPAPLLDATLRAGLSFSSGRAADGGASAAAITLAKEVLRIMVPNKLRLTLIVAAVLGLVGGAMTYLARSDQQPRQNAAIAELTRGPEKESLPAGATARMGTTAFRHGDRILSVAYTPDGKKLVTSSMDQTVRLWDAATGRVLRRFDRSPTEAEKDLPGKGGKLPFGALLLWDEFLTTVSADGKYLATTRNDVVIVWELESGKEVRRLRGSLTAGTMLAFANGGKTLLAADPLGGVEAWDVATGTPGKGIPAPKLPGRKSQTESSGPVLSPDGKRLARPIYDSQSNIYSIQLFDFPSGKAAGTIEFAGVPLSTAFSPDGKTLAAWMTNGEMILADVASGRALGSIKTGNDAGSALSLACGPDGQKLALSREGGSVEVWDAKTRQRNHRLLGTGPLAQPLFFTLGQRQGRSELAFNPDGTRLAVGSFGCGLRLFDLTTGKEVGAGRSGHPSAVRSFGLAADGQTLVTHSRGDGVRIWSLDGGAPVRRVSIPGGNSIVTLSADGASLAALTDGKVVQYDPATGKPKGKLARPEFSAVALSFSPDGRFLAARRDPDLATRLWDVATGKELPTPEGAARPAGELTLFFNRQAQVRSAEVVFSPNGRTLAMTDGQDRLTLFEVATGAWLRHLSLEPGKAVCRFAFSPDGHGLAALNKDGTITLYETVTGRKRARFGNAARVPGPDPATLFSGVALDLAPVGAETPYSLAFSPDGRILATAATGPEIRLWRVLDGRALGSLRGHQGGITCLAFDTSGRRLISGSMDTTALAWDVAGPTGALRPARGKLAAGAAEKLWAALSGDDAEQAFIAIRTLRDAAEDAVALLCQRLRPVKGPDAKRVIQLLTDLESRSFAVRNQATAELEKLGDLIVPASKKVLEGGAALEARQRLQQILKRVRVRAVNGETLAAVRGVEILEQVGSEEARRVLESLAGGAAGSILTESAQHALLRLARRDSSQHGK